MCMPRRRAMCYFPPIDPTVWREVTREEHPAGPDDERQFHGRDLFKALKSDQTRQKAACRRVVTPPCVPYNPSQQGQPASIKPGAGRDFNAME